MSPATTAESSTSPHSAAAINCWFRSKIKVSRLQSFKVSKTCLGTRWRGTRAKDNLETSQSRIHSHGTLPIEMHQVGQDWLRAELAEQRSDLSAMVGAVIHQMLHGLPERVS